MGCVMASEQGCLIIRVWPTMAKNYPADFAKIEKIEAKLPKKTELAKLIDEFNTQTTDDNALVCGLLQASIAYGFMLRVELLLSCARSDCVDKIAKAEV